MAGNAFIRLWRIPVVAALASFSLLSAAAPPGAQPPGGGFGTPVPDKVLAGYRGGHALQINEQNLNAQLFDNQALGNMTGNNLVTGGAFAGASGVPTVIQNSGNNVIIQNATILNVKVQ